MVRRCTKHVHPNTFGERLVPRILCGSLDKGISKLMQLDGTLFIKFASVSVASPHKYLGTPMVLMILQPPRDAGFSSQQFQFAEMYSDMMFD